MAFLDQQAVGFLVLERLVVELPQFQEAEEIRALTTNVAVDMAGPIDAHDPKSTYE